MEPRADEKPCIAWNPARPTTQPINLSSAAPQAQSPLLAKLPLGVRRVIYSHLWALNGLEQHIFVEALWDDEPMIQEPDLPPEGSTSSMSENWNTRGQGDEFHLISRGDEKFRDANILDADAREDNDREDDSASHTDGSLIDADIENGSHHDMDDYFASHPDCPPYVSPAHSMADSSRTPSSRATCSPSSSSPLATQVGHIRRKRCTTDYDHPDISLEEMCSWCKEAYDCLFDRYSNQDPPQERSDFMAMLLVCKSMYGEVLSSIMEDVRWSFTNPQHLSKFLKMQFPMIHLIRWIIVLWDIRQSFGSQLAEWKASLSWLVTLENLRELEIWMDYRRAWANNEERLEMEDPRRARIWAMAPENVHLRVTYPKRVAESYSHEPEDAAPYLVRFVRGTGGWANTQEVHSNVEI